MVSLIYVIEREVSLMDCEEFKDKLIKATQHLKDGVHMNTEKMSHITSLEQEGIVRLKEKVLNFCFNEQEFLLKLKSVDDICIYFFVDSTEEEARKNFGCEKETVNFCDVLLRYLDSFGYYDAFIRFATYPKTFSIVCIEDNLLDETSKRTKILLLKTLNKEEEEEDRKRYGF